MQSIDIELIKTLDNPLGLEVVHSSKAPTLCIIVDGNLNQAYPEKFVSRSKAELVLYRILMGEHSAPSKKKAKKKTKATKKDA